MHGNACKPFQQVTLELKKTFGPLTKENDVIWWDAAMLSRQKGLVQPQQSQDHPGDTKTKGRASYGGLGRDERRHGAQSDQQIKRRMICSDGETVCILNGGGTQIERSHE